MVAQKKETDLRGRNGYQRRWDVKQGENLRQRERRREEILPGRNDGYWPATSPENGNRREWWRRERKEKMRRRWKGGIYRGGRTVESESRSKGKQRTVPSFFFSFFNYFLFLIIWFRDRALPEAAGGRAKGLEGVSTWPKRCRLWRWNLSHSFPSLSSVREFKIGNGKIELYLMVACVFIFSYRLLFYYFGIY